MLKKRNLKSIVHVCSISLILSFTACQANVEPHEQTKDTEQTTTQSGETNTSTVTATTETTVTVVPATPAGTAENQENTSNQTPSENPETPQNQQETPEQIVSGIYTENGLYYIDFVTTENPANGNGAW